MTQHDIRFVEDNWESPVMSPAQGFLFFWFLTILSEREVEILQCGTVCSFE